MGLFPHLGATMRTSLVLAPTPQDPMDLLEGTPAGVRSLTVMPPAEVPETRDFFAVLFHPDELVDNPVSNFTETLQRYGLPVVFANDPNERVWLKIKIQTLPAYVYMGGQTEAVIEFRHGKLEVWHKGGFGSEPPPSLLTQEFPILRMVNIDGLRRPWRWHFEVCP